MNIIEKRRSIRKYKSNKINDDLMNKNPRRRAAGIFILPESCTSGLIPSVTPQSLARETSSVQKVLNPTARIEAVAKLQFLTVFLLGKQLCGQNSGVCKI
ncbi:MAG: hypothetical protein Ta2B_22160 [Termitinemataceae bacterium]|nr:MAG: hypothetical protein Ta2B_22160 [Termitinemataceae bacterium]